jgi:3-hydroxyisobutyrate dehydrogenase-like beta-hydroxyacid dehydrogenase
MRIGYIGLGNQGGGIADAVAHSDHELVVWARRPEVTDSYVERGATAAASPTELAAQCDIVGLCVTGDDDVNAVVIDQGVLEAMRPGAVLVIQSTVRPQTVRGFGSRAAERGVLVLDAPVSGSGDAARNRVLLVMVGGSADAVATATPLFDTCAGTVVHCGGLGDAQIAKLINNGLFTANLKIVLDAFEIGRQLGVDTDTLRRVLMAGSARSYGVEQSERILAANRPSHAVDLLRKDLTLLGELAADHQVDPGDILVQGARATDALETVRGRRGDRTLS